MQIFKLGIGPGGFIQGRRLKSVAAVALYIACRVQTEPNTHMLIDFSDILGVRERTLVPRTRKLVLTYG